MSKKYTLSYGHFQCSLQDADAKSNDKGERNKAIEIVKNLLKNNVDINLIISSTGLSEEEINKIKSDMGL